MGPLPDTLGCGLRMRREDRKRFPCQRLQRNPVISDPGMHNDTCVTHVPWCMSGSLNLRWRGKRSRHSRRMCNPQIYLSGKRPILCFVRVISTHRDLNKMTNIQQNTFWKVFSWLKVIFHSRVIEICGNMSHWFSLLLRFSHGSSD